MWTSPWCKQADRRRSPAAAVHGSAGTSADAKRARTKLFTPRAIQLRRAMVTDVIDKYLGAIDSDEFDVVQQFTAPFPVEIITTMLGMPTGPRATGSLWTDETLHREPGQIEVDERGQAGDRRVDGLLRRGGPAAPSATGGGGPVQPPDRRRDRTRGRHCQRAHRLRDWALQANWVARAPKR